MKVSKFFEFKRGTFTPIKSFRIQGELPTKIWQDFKLDEEVREQLLQIGQDFYDGTEIKADVVDIILCGSLCNYNWSEKYSDYDLHITINLLKNFVIMLKRYGINNMISKSKVMKLRFVFRMMW